MSPNKSEQPGHAGRPRILLCSGWDPSTYQVTNKSLGKMSSGCRSRAGIAGSLALSREAARTAASAVFLYLDCFFPLCCWQNRGVKQQTEHFKFTLTLTSNVELRSIFKSEEMKLNHWPLFLLFLFCWLCLLYSYKLSFHHIDSVLIIAMFHFWDGCLVQLCYRPI